MQHLLSDAAKAIMKRLENDLEGMKLREKDEYYRYGQTITTSESRKPTPASGIARSETNHSVDMVGSRRVTPTQNRAAIPLQASNADGETTIVSGTHNRSTPIS